MNVQAKPFFSSPLITASPPEIQPFFQPLAGSFSEADSHIEPSQVPDNESPEVFAQEESDVQSEVPAVEPPAVQPKLTIGQPDDPFEREAEAMADAVTAEPVAEVADAPAVQAAPMPPVAASIAPVIQKLAEPEEPEPELLPEAPEIQTVPVAAPPPPEAGDEEEGNSTGVSFEQGLSRQKGQGTPLAPSVREEMEQGFGADFSEVRIHTGEAAAQLSQQIHAQAFTSGKDIFFNTGKYAPEAPEGKHLLAHELTHTVQQGATAVHEAPDIQLLGIDTIVALASAAGVDLSIYARHVPGFTLFTVIAGQNPLTGEAVERTPHNLVGGLMGLVPFGTAMFDKLVELGVIDRALQWIEGALAAANLTVSRVVAALEAAWNEMSVSEGWDFNLAVIRRHFAGILADVTRFALTLVQQLVTWIKEALVLPLHQLVSTNQAYALLTKILRFDPITGQAVSATTVEILEGFLRLIGRETEIEQMREKGTLQRTADWIDTQLGRFMGLLGELRGLFDAAWAAIQPENLAQIGERLQALAGQFTAFLGRVWDFATTVAGQVLEFIKDSLLGLLRQHAHLIRGYRLFTVILGRDPVTGQPVERTSRALIAGFLELAAGPEQYRQLEETGAIDRMAAWVDGLIARYGITPEFVRDLFLGIWNSLTIQDLVSPLEAFNRILTTFREPIVRLLSFAIEVVRKLIEVALEVMNFPSELIGQIIERAMAAVEQIQQDPVGFLINLLRALKQGFVQFFGNIGTHLLGGLTGWLMQELADAGIRPPTDFSLRGIVGFVMEVLGITMERIWQKMAEHPSIGPERVARVRRFLESAGEAAEGVWSFIQDIQRDGIGAIWRHIQDQISNLWETVLDAVKNWITERIITQVVTRLLSMLDPTGIMAVVNSFIAFYRAVQSFIERLRQILEVINSFVGGIGEIARGVLQTAADFLERTMARSLPVIIGFLANQVGLRNLGNRIAEMIERVRALVDQALTWLVERAVRLGGRILEMGRAGVAQVAGWLGLQRAFRADNGEQHSLQIGEGDRDQLIISSTPMSYHQFLDTIPVTPENQALREEARTLITRFYQIRSEAIPENLSEADKERRRNQKRNQLIQLLEGQLWPVTNRLISMNGEQGHTGESNDPIPLIWFKPHLANSSFYPNIETRQGERFDANGGTRQGGLYVPPSIQSSEFELDAENQLPIGVSRAYMVSADKRLFRRRGSRSRLTQFYRSVLTHHGVNLSGLQIDHVTDLNWGGDDVFQNLWPLDSNANESAGNRINQQIVVWKAGSESRPLPAGSPQLDNKHFKVTRLEN